MAWFAGIVPALSAASTAATVAVTAAQARGQQKVGEYNAKLSEAAAKAEADQAAREEEALRRQNRSFFGRQRAAIAEAGLGPGGTTGLLADQSSQLAELDALNIRYGGTLRGQGLLSEASMRRLSGRSAARSGYALAGSQLLAGASRGSRASSIYAE